jgi:quercetin dioxygenase-like cupin family protein
MALPHAAPGDLIELVPRDTPLLETTTQAFFKTAQLEAMRLVLLRGEQFPEHQVSGDITVQCLQGQVRLRLPNSDVDMTPGTMLYLCGGTSHALEALEDAIVLVTIVLPAKT